jgi:hypothetical protein
MNGTNASSRVPVEFIGKARAFRSTIVGEHALAVAAMDRLVLPLRGRHYSRQTPGPGAFARVEHAWRSQVPTAGQLRLTTTHDSKRLCITEIRAVPTDFRFLAWPEGATESCLIILVSALAVSAGHFSFTSALAASVSLHALARRYERGSNNSAAAIRADLVALMRPVDDVLEGSNDFTIPAGDGQWVGEATEVDDRGKVKCILAARSFISVDMTASATALAHADAP